MTIPFWKAHGAGNDFLYTFPDGSDLAEETLPRLAAAICHRNTGVGADGWYLVGVPGPDGADAKIRLFNSDGSAAELSGNGTRGAAAVLLEAGMVRGPRVIIATGAGAVELEVTVRRGPEYHIAMRLPPPVVLDAHATIEGSSAAILDVGNPQCAVPVDSLDFDWRAPGAALEGHPRFPARTNVSFFRRRDDRTIEARFYERGAGPTLSSGTGSVGAAVAAIVRRLVESPVTVITEGGRLTVGWGGSGEPAMLTGPAAVTVRGVWFAAL